MLADRLHKAYPGAMTKRTSINLDLELVARARDVLETKGATDTIHRALSEVVRQARLKRLAHRRFDLSHADLEEIRRSRTDDVAVPVSVRPRTST